MFLASGAAMTLERTPSQQELLTHHALEQEMVQSQEQQQEQKKTVIFNTTSLVLSVFLVCILYCRLSKRSRPKFGFLVNKKRQSRGPFTNLPRLVRPMRKRSRPWLLPLSLSLPLLAVRRKMKSE